MFEKWSIVGHCYNWLNYSCSLCKFKWVESCSSVTCSYSQLGTTYVQQAWSSASTDVRLHNQNGEQIKRLDFSDCSFHRQPLMQKNESALTTENESVIITDAYGWPTHIIKCYLCVLKLTYAVFLSVHLCMITWLHPWHFTLIKL